MPTKEENEMSAETINELKLQVAEYRRELRDIENALKERIHSIERQADATTAVLGSEALRTGIFGRMDELKNLVIEGTKQIEALASAMNAARVTAAAQVAAEDSKKSTMKTVFTFLTNPLVVTIILWLLFLYMKNPVIVMGGKP